MPMKATQMAETLKFGSVESAWASGGEMAAVDAAIRKYARVIDMTDSGRDMKPLITGMFEAIDRKKALEAAATPADTPLAEVMRRRAVNG